MEVKRKIQQVINVFETGEIDGDYTNVSIYRDGTAPNGNKIYQVTYGKSQTTEGGNLKYLVELYVLKNGKYSEQLKAYLDKFNIIKGFNTILSLDKDFQGLLIRAGLDPVMIETQDLFFDEVYFNPALKWFNDNGFKENLSLLVIYDSFIHSGSVPMFLRNRFGEATPANGGDEKKWIVDYINARFSWLRWHKNKDLRRTVYRMLTFMSCYDDWQLNNPIKTNGVLVA